MVVLEETKETMGIPVEMVLLEETALRVRQVCLVRTEDQERIKLVFGYQELKALTARMDAEVRVAVLVGAVDVRRVPFVITVPEMVDLAVVAAAKAAKAVRADMVPEVRLESILIITALMEIS
jgi:hypothetical protein